MAILKIRKYGDEILAKKAKRVNFNTVKDFNKTVNDMTQTCMAMGGVGLAAPQAGLDMHMAVIMLPVGKDEDKTYKRYVLVNPEISSAKGSVTSDEGCLSFPGLDIQIERAEEIKVTYLNETGLPSELNAKGYFAVILQHEIDHLNGKVFIDHLKGEAKTAAKAKISELRKNW